MTVSPYDFGVRARSRLAADEAGFVSQSVSIPPRRYHTSQARVLVVQFEQALSRPLVDYLEQTSRSVVLANAQEACAQLARNTFDLVVLDCLPSDTQWLEMMRALRVAAPRTPILTLTAQLAEFDRIVGVSLSAGGSVMTQISTFDLLLSHLETILRPSETPRSASEESGKGCLRFGDLVIDSEKREVYRAERRIALTKKEFDLLLVLVRNPGRVCSRRQLLDLVWGGDDDIFEQTVNTHISHLRAKIALRPGGPCYIEAVWGVGYRFTAPCPNGCGD